MFFAVSGGLFFGGVSFFHGPLIAGIKTFKL